jgi:Leucine-rich repeat (LRR) protein
MSGDFRNITVIRAPLAGSGTASDPFVIENAQDWAIFAGNVSDGIDADKYYKLSDIYNNADSPITDIVGVDGYPFRGHFDGNNKTLSVNINGQAPFCCIEGATIENLNVTGSVNYSNYHAAGLVGTIGGTENYILNCHVATNVDCPGYAGGIVGHGGSSTLTMNGCVYSGQISGFDVCAGGLMGWSDSMTLHMNNCLFKGSFNGSGSYHPVALSCYGESSSVVANVYYIHTAAPTIDYYLLPGADGIPVSETLIADIWEEPVVAVDGNTYYMPSNKIIEFADAEVKRICLERWAQWDTNGDGEFSRYEASLVADDMSYMFYYKESITSFDELKYFTGIKSIGDDAFDGCSSLTSVDLSNCTSIGSYAFNNCTNLASVDLSNCTSIGSYAFCGTNLACVDLSNCTSIGDWAFGCCGELASVALSNCTNIGNAAFNGCSSLTSVDLSNCTSIGSDAFNGCSSLTSVGDLSNCTYLGEGCFKDSGIDIITLPGNTVATLGSSNNWGDALVFVPELLLSEYQSDDNWKDIKNKIFAIGSQTEYDLTVTAQSNRSQLTKTIGEDKLGSVVSLKLSGTINSYDIMVMRNKMPNLQHLDLTDVSIVTNNYEYYTGYHSENDVLGPYCFHEVSNLRTVKLPKTIKSIGDNAFSSSGVREVVIPGDVLETIGYMTFANCNNLQKVTLSGNLLREISAEVFWCCYNLQYVDIPEGVEQIGANAFYGCSSLQNVTLPSSLRDIDSSAFQYTGLTSVKLPARLNSIGDGAFSYCGNLTELHIPSMMTRIGDYAFDGCDNLLDIWTHHLVPQNIDQHTFSTYQTATLHIIKTSYDDYYWNTQWSQFLDLVEFAYEDLDSEYDMYKQVWLINNNTDFTVDDDKGVIDNTQDSYGQIGEGSALICENESENQTVGTIELDVNDEAAATLIENGNLTVDQMQFNIAVNGGQWYFFSFPFRISLDNISCEGEWLFRYYDSDARARGESGWQDLPAGTEWLEPGMGYIFQSNEGGTLIVTVNQADVKLGGLDVNQKLTIYSGQSAENSSWNFLGNPYTSYFNVGNTGYDCPVTVWNGYEYVTVEPGSDYYLRPFQAYFVQKPEDITEISFSADNRETYNQTQASAGAKPMLLKKASESQTTSIPLATTSRHQMSIQRVNAMSSTFNPVNPPEPMSTQTNVDMERGITTAVNSIDTEENDKTIYNTSGQRINKVQRGGVNIIRDQSGKTRKVLVK